MATIWKREHKAKGLPTPSESECESEKDERTIGRDQRTNGKHQRKFSLSLSLSLGLNTALVNKPWYCVNNTFHIDLYSLFWNIFQKKQEGISVECQSSVCWQSGPFSEQVWSCTGGSLYREGNNDIMSGQTDTTENFTFLQISLAMGKISVSVTR